MTDLRTVQGHLCAQVQSYATIEAYDLRDTPSEHPWLNWQDTYQIPVAAVGLADGPQGWLVSPEGPFAGATLLVESTPLERVQSLKWAAIKAERDRLETAGFPYLGRILDSDSRSVQRITTAVQSAQAALAAGGAFTVEWTCADNSVLPLDGQQMVGVPVALAVYADSLHEIARGLRMAIYAEGATEASVAAIVWPLTMP